MVETIRHEYSECTMPMHPVSFDIGSATYLLMYLVIGSKSIEVAWALLTPQMCENCIYLNRMQQGGHTVSFIAFY